MGALTAEAAHVYALPEGDPRCDLYRVTVDGQDVPVSAMRVSAMPVNIRWPGHQRETDQTEIAGFVRFEMSGPVTLSVVRTRDFKQAKIRPYSKGVSLKTDGRRVTFTLEKTGDYSLEFDGQHENLHIFAMPPSAYGVKKGKGVRYFGPGVHEAGLMELKSGETVYIDEGAVVHGRIFAKDADDISILGRGILDMSAIHEESVPIDPALAAEQRRKGFAITNVRRYDGIRLEYCDRVRIDGITLRDSLLYNIRPICCRDLDIRNVKIVGSWRYNADGIDMHNCERVRIADCFLRTYDDAICIKGFDYGMDESLMLHDGYRHDVFRDVRIERCTFWNDWGMSLEFGAETRAREITDVVWRDCDVLRAHATACDIQNCDYADIHGILFEDIRLEYDDFYPKTVLSASAKDFDPKADAGLPRAISALVVVVPEYSKNDRRRGRVHDVTYRNIAVTAPFQPPVRFAGYDAEHRITDMTIEGFFLNGVDITKTLKVDCGPFADPPTLKPVKSGKENDSLVKVEWSEKDGEKWTIQGMADREAGRPMAKDTVFSTQSNTKTVASVLLLTFVEDGTLGLDDPVSKYIPEFADIKLKGKPPKNPVTLRHLVAHTSGLAVFSVHNDGVFTDFTPYRDQIRLILEKGLRCEPGTEYHYCSSGFQVMGTVLEKVTGRTVPELMKERIFDPLEMKEATFYPDATMMARVAVPYYHPPKGGAPVRYDLSNRMTLPLDNRARTALLSSGIFCTAGDFLKFSQMIARKGLGLNGRRILSEKTFDEILLVRQTPPGDKSDSSFDIGFNKDHTGGSKGGLYATSSKWNWAERSCVVAFKAKSPYPPKGTKSELDASGFGGKPAVFAVTDLTVADGRVTCRVSNNEDRHGVGTVRLTVNGAVVAERRIALAIGESKSVAFACAAKDGDKVEVVPVVGATAAK